MVLAALVGMNRECVIQELCDRVAEQRRESISATLVHRTVMRLEDRGFVECSFEQNRRGSPGRPRKLIAATPAGLRKLQSLRQVLETVTALASRPPADESWEPGAFLRES